MKKLMLLLLIFTATAGLMAQTQNVTFKVNMNEVTDPFTTPEVNGSFNGWCGGCAPMSDPDLDGIWEVTIALAPGLYEYKYAYDSWTGQENLIPGSICTVTNFGFTNRSLEVTTSDIVMSPVCWASCDDCGVSSTSNITFQVNMTGVTDPFTTPEVNGNFNGWCGGCAPMSDANNDGIWEITIPLAAGTYEYKFAFDSWTGQESLTPGDPCTITTDIFTNRLLTVSDDVVLDPVIWATCNAINTTITPIGSTTICHGSNTTFSASSGYTSYQWKKNGVNIPGATSISYVANATGNYSATIYSGTSYATSNESTLVVSKPAPKITVIGSLDICATGSVLLKGKVGVGSTFQWFKNGVLIVGAGKNLTVTEAGVYKLTETTSAGCIKSKSVMVTSSCRLNGASTENNDIAIYPNPAKDAFTIEYYNSDFADEKISLIIYSTTGIEIYNESIQSNNGAVIQTVALNRNIATGIYLIKIIGSNSSFTKTLVVE